MDIKAILFDFDGTALQRDQVFISMRNMHALEEAARRGIHVIPCTGRCADMFPPQIARDPIFRYYVSGSGSRVLDRETGEVLYLDTFTPEETAQICEIFEGEEVYCEIAAEAKIYMERAVSEHLYRYPVPRHHTWYVAEGRQIPIDKPSEYFRARHIGAEKFNLYGVPEEKQKPFDDRLRELGFIDFLDGPLVDMQFTSSRLDKVAGVKALLDRLGLGFKNIMSIGDSPKMDGCIIERAGLGIAMGNAPQDLKDRAFDTTAPFDEDGLALAIEKYLL